MDGDVPIANVATMDSLLENAVAQPRLQLWVLGAFATLAVLLAAVGIYGVMAYTVSQRTREIGIRIALGAAQRDVVALVLGQGGRLVAIGVVLGEAGALTLTRVMRGLLFEVSPTDPVIFATVAAGLGVLAVLASYLPARRAARVDPIVALRYE
jgi:ABC-type antimicrobial peptide transport system permease subunit